MGLDEVDFRVASGFGACGGEVDGVGAGSLVEVVAFGVGVGDGDEGYFIACARLDSMVDICDFRDEIVEDEQVVTVEVIWLRREASLKAISVCKAAIFV